MPILQWLNKDDAVVKAKHCAYRLLEEVPELSYGDEDNENLLIQQCCQQCNFTKSAFITLHINAACHLHRFFIMLPCNGELVVAPFSRHLSQHRIFTALLKQPILVGHESGDELNRITKKNLTLELATCHYNKFRNNRID